MLSDSIMGLGIAIIVISSVAWVGPWRKIMQRIKVRRAVRAGHAAAKTAR
jgi:hypothetical protein